MGSIWEERSTRALLSLLSSRQPDAAAVLAAVEAVLLATGREGACATTGASSARHALAGVSLPRLRTIDKNGACFGGTDTSANPTARMAGPGERVLPGA